ncbi:NAD(P)-binding oxidoreductase [Paenibacillus sedimenti]|uniref:SDR family oxidoreductase n=1 Tax=Paenibacillus sedimenti TaxID=2770274 RepID=A0A926KX10_9BACL|nr:NAD(P)-binding oxidoreductase [Paenibacillus sedimenti]MBD0384706.1 SDR family oxidoreductase [Paenibacillus sedimenti]
MKVLLIGASGATGRLVVRQLANRNIATRIVIRKTASMPEDLINNKLVECIAGNISEFDSEKNINLVKGCDAVVCCLGHNLTFKGMFGKPRFLVYLSLKNVCDAIIKNANQQVRIILMNTTGNINNEIDENRSVGEKIVISMLTALLPPQRDNVYAANYLLNTVGKKNSMIVWTVVRPDSLVNNEEESPYDVVEAPTRSAIFNPGKTSRINVSRFMAELIINNELWNKWKYKMPVIYNKEE